MEKQIKSLTMPNARTLTAISYESGIPITSVRSYFDPRNDPRISTSDAVERALTRMGLGALKRGSGEPVPKELRAEKRLKPLIEELKEDPNHTSHNRNGYELGCRCDKCKAGHTQQKKERLHRKWGRLNEENERLNKELYETSKALVESREEIQTLKNLLSSKDKKEPSHRIKRNDLWKIAARECLDPRTLLAVLKDPASANKSNARARAADVLRHEGILIDGS